MYIKKKVTLRFESVRLVHLFLYPPLTPLGPTCCRIILGLGGVSLSRGASGQQHLTFCHRHSKPCLHLSLPPPYLSAGHLIPNTMSEYTSDRARMTLLQKSVRREGIVFQSHTTCKTVLNNSYRSARQHLAWFHQQP